MKNRIKKVLAVFISIMLVLSTVPFFSLISLAGTAKNSESPENLLANLKTSWSNMEKSVLDSHGAQGNSGLTYVMYPITDKDNLPSGYENLEYFGTHYNVITLNETKAYSTGLGSYLKLQGTEDNPQNWKVYLNVYVSKMNGESISLYTRFRGGNNGAGDNTGKQYTINKTDVGKWIALDITDLTPEGKISVATISNSIISNFYGTTGDKLIISSYLFTEKASLPADSDAWTLEQGVAAAENLDLSGYYNVEDFKDALSKAKAYFDNESPETKLIKNLKNAWSGLEVREHDSWAYNAGTGNNTPTRVTYKLTNDVASNETGVTAYDTSKLPTAVENLPETFGNYYSTVKLNATVTDTSSHASYLVNIGTAKNPTDWNVYLNVYVKTMKGNGITLYTKYRNQGGDGASTGKLHTIGKSDVGKWITLNVNDLTPNGKIPVADIGNNIISYFYGTSGDELVVGSYVFTSKIPLPENTDDWNISKWVTAAQGVSLENKINKEPFVEALNAAVAYMNDNGVGFYEISSGPVNNSELSQLGTNMLDGIAPTVTYFNGTNIVTPTGAADYSKYSDGDLTTSLRFNDVTLDGSANKYLQLVYAPAKFMTINKLVLALDGIIGAYDIYVSENLTDLFKEPAISIKEKAQFGSSQNVELYKEISGSYFAIRFYGNADNTFVLKELAAFGTIRDYKTKSGEFTNEYIKSLGTNLLKGLKPTTYLNGAKLTDDSDENIVLLTDGDAKCQENKPYVNKYADYSGKGTADVQTFDMVFNLKKNYKFSHFDIESFRTNPLEIGHYQIFIASNKSELFKAENLVIDYNNTTSGENGTTFSQLQSFAENALITGKFVGFRVLSTVSDWELANQMYPNLLYLRFNELGAYGTLYTPPGKLTNLLPHMPLKVYKGNKVLSESEFGLSQTLALYDGNKTTAIPITADNKEISFVFNLCGEMNIDEINTFAASSQLKEVAVYASDKEDDLWTDAALVYESKSEIGKNAVLKAFDTSLKTRYIRIAVKKIDGTTLNISELEVVGLDNQLLDYYNLVSDNLESVTIYERDNKSGFYSTYSQHQYSKYTQPRLPRINMLDGDTDTLTDIYTAQNGKSTIDIVVDLGGVYSVDKLSLLAGSSKEWWPQEMEIYMGTTEESVMGDNLKAAYTFDALPEDGNFSYSFIPQYIRYVCFRIVKTDNPYLTKHMCAVIKELEVCGMAVSGRVTEDIDAVLSFKDPETSIKVNILKLYDNDAFETVRGISIESIKPSDSEKKTLGDYSIMIYGQKHIIKLLDKNGKAVTDIGGREIKVFLPVPSGMSADSMYMAVLASEAIICETEIHENSIAAIFDNTDELTVALAGYVTEYPEGYWGDTVDDKEEDDDTSNENQQFGNQHFGSDTQPDDIGTRYVIKDDNTGISVSFDNGVLPGDSNIKVDELKLSALPKKVQKMLSGVNYKAFDISIVSQNSEIIPQSAVLLSM